MTKEEVLAEILKHHDPELANVEGGMVAEVWEDGEVTSTKCGSLFRRRNLHMLKPGMQYNTEIVRFFRDNLPIKGTPYSSAYVPHTVAEQLGEMIDRI